MKAKHRLSCLFFLLPFIGVAVAFPIAWWVHQGLGGLIGCGSLLLFCGQWSWVIISGLMDNRETKEKAVEERLVLAPARQLLIRPTYYSDPDDKSILLIPLAPSVSIPTVITYVHEVYSNSELANVAMRTVELDIDAEQMPPGELLSLYVAQSHVVILVVDSAEDYDRLQAAIKAAEKTITSLVVFAPILHDGRAVGVLCNSPENEDYCWGGVVCDGGKRRIVVSWHSIHDPKDEENKRGMVVCYSDGTQAHLGDTVLVKRGGSRGRTMTVDYLTGESPYNEKDEMEGVAFFHCGDGKHEWYRNVEPDKKLPPEVVLVRRA